MQWLELLIGVAFILWGAFIGLFPRAWRDEQWRRASAESDSRGYRLNIVNIWLWVDASRLRSTLVALIFLVVGLFIIALRRAAS